MCSHCGVVGHIVDKCYKLHGFPPGYKSRGNAHAANQVSVLEEPHMPITQAQCQQLLALLSSQASLYAVPPPQTPPPASSQPEASSSTPHQVATASSQFLLDIYHSFFPNFIPRHSVFSVQPSQQPFLSQNKWIIDTGATNHMVYSLSSFTSLLQFTVIFTYLMDKEC